MTQSMNLWNQNWKEQEARIERRRIRHMEKSKSKQIKKRQSFMARSKLMESVPEEDEENEEEEEEEFEREVRGGRGGENDERRGSETLTYSSRSSSHEFSDGRYSRDPSLGCHSSSSSDSDSVSSSEDSTKSSSSSSTSSSSSDGGQEASKESILAIEPAGKEKNSYRSRYPKLFFLSDLQI